MSSSSENNLVLLFKFLLHESCSIWVHGAWESLSFHDGMMSACRTYISKKCCSACSFCWAPHEPSFDCVDMRSIHTALSSHSNALFLYEVQICLFHGPAYTSKQKVENYFEKFCFTIILLASYILWAIRCTFLCSSTWNKVVASSIISHLLSASRKTSFF